MTRMPTFPTRLDIRSYGSAPGSHSHDHFQVLWPLQGCLELEVEGKGMALAVGNGLLVRPGERHDFESRQGSRCLVLDTSDPTWEHRSVHPRHPRAASQLATFLATALEEGLSMVSASGPPLLAQTWGAPLAPQRHRRPVNWTALHTSVSARPDHPWLIRELADQVHLSESQFRARCLEELGCTPMQLVRRLRLDKARQLRAMGVSVADTARQVGYDSPSALTAALRKSHGA